MKRPRARSRVAAWRVWLQRVAQLLWPCLVGVPPPPPETKVTFASDACSMTFGTTKGLRVFCFFTVVLPESKSGRKTIRTGQSCQRSLSKFQTRNGRRRKIFKLLFYKTLVTACGLPEGRMMADPPQSAAV